MEIDANADCDALSEDNSTVRALSEDERAIYASLIKNVAEIMGEIMNYREENGGLDPEAPELADSREELQTAITLANLIEGAASRRRMLLEIESSGDDIAPSTSHEIDR